MMSIIKKKGTCYIKKNILALAILLTVNSIYAQDDEDQNASSEISEISEIYIAKCAGCHGKDGDGEGPGANILDPKPRNFMTWMFKYKSTPVDYPPLDEDIEQIIKNGLPGTAMPGFEKTLNRMQIQELAQYLKRFSLFEIEELDSLPVVEIIQPNQKPDVERGLDLYKKFDCAKCHGEKGRGDGPSFSELEDDWENKILPRNFTKSWTYRRGSTLDGIYITLKLGIPGTPMPSFVETLEQEGMESSNVEFDLWSLAAYVKSMQEDENLGTTIKAKFTEVISIDPDDNIWKNIKPVRFPLFGQVIIPPRHFTPSVEDLLLKAINNGREIAILIQWDDPTETNDSLPDKLVIQMPVQLKGRKRPFFFMGDKNNPVNMWVFDNGEIYDGYANGAGTLVKQSNNHLAGFWKYKNGRYTVIFKRALNTGDENDIALELKKFTTASFIVWNGQQGETGLKCAVSQWFYLVLEEEASMKIWYIPAIVVLITFLIEFQIIKRVPKKNIKQGEENPTRNS